MPGVEGEEVVIATMRRAVRVGCTIYLKETGPRRKENRC